MNPILAFLKELVTRYKQKSPKFFQIIQWISAAVALIAGLPEALDFIFTYFNLGEIPEWLASLENKVVAIAALVGVFLSGLPVDQSKLTKVDEVEVLPFTTSQGE